MKNEGLINKYSVTKVSSPFKEVDCIVLEFSDKLAHNAIWEWASDMLENGYPLVYRDVIKKLRDNGGRYKDAIAHKYCSRCGKENQPSNKDLLCAQCMETIK